MPLWFARVLRDGFALAAMGSYRGPHPDVEPALRALREAGVPAVTLTNGGASLVATLLDRAGLSSYVHRSFSVDDVPRWKPAPEPYRLVSDRLGVEPAQVALVASHPWDCAGASAAGLVAGWVNRTAAPWPAVFTAPAVTGDSLTAVVAALLDEPR